MTKVIAFGIMVILTALFVSGCLSSNPEKKFDIVTPPPTPIITPEQKIDILKIDVRFNEYKIDLFMDNQGGPAIVYSQVTIKNNNNKPINVKAVCTDRSTMNLNNIFCYDSNLATIEEFSSKVLEVKWAAAISPMSVPGTYYGALEAHLYDEKGSDKTIAEAPVTLNVHKNY